jgi:hypothetical protein
MKLSAATTELFNDIKNKIIHETIHETDEEILNYTKVEKKDNLSSRDKVNLAINDIKMNPIYSDLSRHTNDLIKELKKDLDGCSYDDIMDAISYMLSYRAFLRHKGKQNYYVYNGFNDGSGKPGGYIIKSYTDAEVKFLEECGCSFTKIESSYDNTDYIHDPFIHYNPKYVKRSPIAKEGEGIVKENL